MSQKQILGVLFGVSLALTGNAAFALDVDAFVRSIETAGVGGLTYLGRARAAGEAVVVDNVGVELGDTTFLLEGQFTFAGITMQPDGGYVVETISAPEIVLRDTSTRVVTARLNDFSLTGYVVPGESGSDGTFPSFAIDAGLFTWRDVPMMVVEGFSIGIEPTFANEALTGVALSAAVRGLTFNLTDFPPRSDTFAKMLVALDVDELALDLSDSIVWQDSGLVTYINHTGFGEFGASRTELVVSGLTQDKVEKYIAFMAAAEQGSPDIAQALVSALIGVVIDDASIRIDAGPLLKEVIDYLADERGDRDTVLAEAEQAGMTVIETLDVPELAAQARPALRAFLAEPSSLEARINPPAPVTLISLMVAAAVAKTGIVPLLGPTFTANEPLRPDAP
ncbi:hypothetical protein [Devosia ginsengisoli]|uniref:DUF945 domain-containing protein n=1 Tax=Devosia ginsengisoli TaxID=400770 RepID=A0A5B8LWA5_9HYPH|nr:hypothetical protein [Devosia ginsengisoli]QDZ12678.1 hypothetical protein FPZ08_19175 [Devosia ginsengisoli]